MPREMHRPPKDFSSTATRGFKDGIGKEHSDTFRSDLHNNIPVAEAFDRAVPPFFACTQTNSKESRTLATLRDTLLPKLLSGELSVKILNPRAS